MPLTLDLVRHGHAEGSGPTGDASRPLSARGRRDVALLARGLHAGDWRPTRAFTSPLDRAKETAAILLDDLDGAPTPAALDALEPDGEPEEVIAALKAAGATSGHVLVVAHMPMLGRLAASLAGEGAGFHPGTLVRISFTQSLAAGRGQVTLTLHPAAGG